MKRQKLIFILLILSSSLLGQSFPLKSSKWYHANNGGSQPPNSTLTIFEYVKDTTINDTVGRMLSNGLIFYTQNDTVYYYNTKQNKFGLLYDFSANVGDTLEISMSPYVPTEELSFKVVVESVTQEIYSNDTLLKFLTDPINPDFHFEDNIYMTRIGSFGFLPTWGVSIPEGDYLKCYMDSSIYINYSGIPCDSLVTGMDEKNMTNGFSIYPNPTKGELRIIPINYVDYSISIYNNLGKLIFKDNYVDREERIIDISSYSSGIYHILIICEKKTIMTKKIVVE